MASLENFRLVVFRAVAEQLSFRKAAEELYLTKPAVSLQIKALEEDLGIQLFDRSGVQVKLTEPDAVLLRCAQQATALFREAEQAIAALSGDHAGEMALGASTTIAQYVLPRLLGEFGREHPRVRLTLISGNTEKIVGAVERQEIILGCIEGPAHSREVKIEPFLLDELVMIVPTAHEWAERVSVSADEIPNTALSMRERGSGTRQVVEMALEHRHVKRSSLKIVMELDSTEAIKPAVEVGLSAGSVSRWALAKDVRLGGTSKIVEIEGLRMRRGFLLTYRAGLEPQGPAQEFRRFLLTRTGKMRGAGRQPGRIVSPE
jgi:LysR family transcriptional regulator, transcriptional activator of the cysJI operon